MSNNLCQRKMTGIYIFRRITYHFESICGIEMVAGAHRSQQISNKCFGKQKRIGGNDEIHFKRRKSIPEYSLKMQWHMICQSGFQCDFRGIQCCLFYSKKWETTKCPPNLLWDCTDWERERNKVQSLIQILRKHHTFGTLRVRWDNKRALWGMWQANRRGCSSIRQGIDVYTVHINREEAVWCVCVFLAESEKWNIARYLPISLRYSHEMRLSNKYCVCVLCCLLANS